MRHGAERLATLRWPRVQSLLAYLLVHRDAPQPRQRLAFLLWPDSTEAQARTNLRQLLHHLRRGMPDADRYLENSTTIRMRADASMWVDVVAFERLADQAAGGRATVDDLIDAVGSTVAICYRAVTTTGSSTSARAYVGA